MVNSWGQLTTRSMHHDCGASARSELTRLIQKSQPHPAMNAAAAGGKKMARTTRTMSDPRTGMVMVLICARAKVVK